MDNRDEVRQFLFEAMPLPDDPGLTLTAYTAEPGTPSHDGLRLLATWTATSGQADPAHAADRDG